MQTVCDHCSITLNKNAVLGDKSALTPGGVRVGTPALTTRGNHPRTRNPPTRKPANTRQKVSSMITLLIYIPFSYYKIYPSPLCTPLCIVPSSHIDLYPSLV